MHSIFIHLLFLLCVSIVASVTVEELEIDVTKVYSLQKGEIKRFCYDHPEDLNVAKVFDKILISIKSVKNVDLPWYSVKGISTDDFHTHFQTIVFALLGGDKRSDMIESIDPLNKGSFMRDVVSSCPNPLYGSDRSECTMSFSTLGTSCATIVADEKVDITAEVKRAFNEKSYLLLAAGLILLALARQLAKSKIFQYSSGLLSFVVGALVLTILYMAFNLGRKDSKGNSFMRDTTIMLICGGGYASGLIYFLRENFSTLLLQHWEVTMAYLAVSSSLGLFVTRLIRGNESSKHALTTVVKWFIRLVGTGLIYNAFSSPLVSLFAVTVLAIVYFLYMVGKWVSGMLNKKEKDKKDKKAGKSA